MRIYRGIVENNKDPEMISRVQVRILGIHTQFEEGELEGAPTSDLPWAEVIGSTIFGLSKGIGASSVLQIGTWVWVILEEDDPNRPVVIGTITGKPKNAEDSNESDNARVSRGDLSDPNITRKNNNVDETAGEPKQKASEYTLNQSITTPSGNVIELDDTPGNERIQLLDSSGNYYEMSLARIIEKAVNDKLQIIQKNIFSWVSGAIEINASGNMVLKNDLLVEGKIQATGDIKSDTTVYDNYSSLQVLRETYDRHYHIGNLGYPTSQAIISDPGANTPDVVITYA